MSDPTPLERAWLILEHVAEHGAPPAPRFGDAPNVALFPGAGFDVGDELDYPALNAYAELVGWPWRFEPPLRMLPVDEVEVSTAAARPPMGTP